MKKLDISNELFDKNSYEAILSKADFSSRQIEGVPGGGNYCRATFVEIVIRLAHHMYSAVHDRRDLRNDYNQVGLPMALKLFLEGKLTNYFTS